jgi:hypothetical protein
MDADLQNDAADIPKLLKVLESGEADCAIGWRRDRRDPLSKKVISKVANGVRNWMTSETVKDTGCGLKAFRRQALLPVVAQCVVDMDVFASELVIRAWRQGLRVVEIPIQLHEKRQPSIHLFRRVPNVLRNVAKLVYVIRVRGG